MTKRRKQAISGPPLRLIFGDKDISKSARYDRPILCHICKKGGGTLVKTNDGKYRHQSCGGRR